MKDIDYTIILCYRAEKGVIAMSEVLRMDPSRQDAARYLAVARARLAGTPPRETPKGPW